MPNHPTSYRKLFLRFNDTDDIIEKDVLERIKNDYEKYHLHDLKAYEYLFDLNKTCCPKCNSKNIKVHGYDKNGIKRYKCKECLKTFNKFTNTLFSSSKINIKAWFVFLECILSGTSIKAACLASKISQPTGAEWIKKVFQVLKTYQENIILGDRFYIDETYVHVDSSQVQYKDEIGKIRKTLKHQED